MGFCKLRVNSAWKILLAIFSLPIILLISLMGGQAFADAAETAEYAIPKFNMHYGVTPISRDIYDLHMTIFGICVVIGIIVFSILIYSLFMHRKARGVKPATFHENKTVEIIWAIVPLIILILMAIPATIVLIRMNDTQESAITIKVTGYQWKWEYSYLDQGIQFFSSLSTPHSQRTNKEAKDQWYLLQVDKPLVVPIDEKIRFLVTSNDVIHSWWVPALGIKRDAMPGFIHESWAIIEKPGIYRGQCAELCGINHGFMPIVVEAVTKEQFAQWVQKEKTQENSTAEQQNAAAQQGNNPTAAVAALKTYTANDLMIAGEKQYNTNCAACHQANGEGIPLVYPALKADSVALGSSITRHIDIVLNGVPGTAMQAFGPQLSDFDIAAIVTYERNAWGNRTGDVVQPAEVAKQREIYAQQHQDAVQQQATDAFDKIQTPAAPVVNSK